MIHTTQNSCCAPCATRPARSVAIGFVTSLALVTAPLPVSAQSFLEGKSDGMRRCVTVILHGTGLVKKINVHGHHFNCRPMFRASDERGNFRQIHLAHAQFGVDDQYSVSFKVDGQNVLVPATLKISVVKGVSIDTLKNKAKYLNLTTAINSLLLDLGKNAPAKFTGPSGPDSYDRIARMARAIPAIETKEWETAAFEIALVTIAEHGRSGTRAPSAGKIGTSKSPVLKSQQPSGGMLQLEESGTNESERSP
jgi:hypothetical protein